MNIFDTTLLIAFFVLGVCLLLAAIRFAMGPSLLDRITAFDLIVANVIGIIVIYSKLTRDFELIDVALILSLFGFLGSISFTYYMLRRNN
ncbi:monovalent cation/H+ antiporter complex subunit F [Pontibacter harenae]|uniref:monovalent cation/H+ antiporter complex subunit F n=1 Tax=Pontibacter harenae TaxID=2894083 RepID=UPI001E4738FD|nr:monovalent cation/H+ antiporter complex subunit F [Pontibacter harenae]MCC9167117.1 monovalent cation/H+ antiporter complex subunit F [Pontibacter harenae]